MLSTSQKFQRYFSVSSYHTMRAKAVILNKKFVGVPTADNFKIVEEDLPALKDGEFLAEAELLSVDSYVRMFPSQVGKTMTGQQVAKIVESKNSAYPVGEYVLGEFGWRTHTIGSNSPSDAFLKFKPKILTGYENLPRSLALGALGIPGNAAHFGFLKLCKPEPGQTVLVSSAGSAVGTIVGQIAKIKGCRVVGITGSDAKGKRLLEEVGYDAFVNYKSKDFEKELAAATPNNIDRYFDCVGGEISTSVLNRMNKFGYVAVCGAISTVNETKPLAREVETPIKVQHVIMEGFDVRRWGPEWDVGIEQNKKWIQGGSMKHFETVVNGFDNIINAFIGLFRGENFGKCVVVHTTKQNKTKL